jgi:hypothetical protein
MALWRGTGSLDAALVAFKFTEVAAVAGLIGLFVWYLRPRTLTDAAAATFAIAVLVGTPGFRDNVELPLTYTTVGMPLLLIVWILLEHEHRAWHLPVILTLTILAIGYKEQGLVIVPVVLAAWWMGAPGASRTTAAAMVAIAVIYFAIRFSTSGSWPAFAQDVGLGFTTLSPEQASARFGRFTVAMYAYNVVATVLNILFSEPTSGVFTIARDLRNGNIPAWEINHLISSAGLTLLVVWWGVRALRQNRGTAWSIESRVFVATVVAVAASGVLGFNYTRDRLGGMGAVFYALAAFHAVRAVAERVVQASPAAVVSGGLALLLLAMGWQLRTIGTVEHARLTAFKDRREWITNIQRRRTEFANRAAYLRILDAMIDQGTSASAPRPTPLPRQAASLIGGS